MKQVGQQLQPGGAAVFALVRSASPDAVLDELGTFGGTVLRASPSREADDRLRAALQHSGAQQ